MVDLVHENTRLRAALVRMVDQMENLIDETERLLREVRSDATQDHRDAETGPEETFLR